MIKRITMIAMLTAIALLMFVVESQIPPLAPIPGIKLGLANIVTVYAMFQLGPKDTLAILLCRIFLGNLFAGQIMSFYFSLTGGLFCYLSMLVFRRLLAENQIWVCGVIGAIFHNVGQICVAMLLYRTVSVALYLPVLMVSGIITGLFIGMCAQKIIKRLPNPNG